MSVQPARRIALDVIRAVHDSDAYANLLLPVRLQRAKLSPADAGFTTELTYGTLRMQGYYDAVIAIAAGREVSRIDPGILDVLRLGTHQLLSLRVADHAAVGESVEQAKSVGSRSAVGFTNGVLRTISRTEPEEWRRRVLAGKHGDEALALAHSHPLWVERAFKSALAAEGREAELEALLEADNAAPRVTLTALPGRTTVADLNLPGTPHSPLGAVSPSGDPLGVRSVRTGDARVQDEGSQLAALALSRARPVEAGEQWLDMCAGPGGKAALLAAEALQGGAVLTANEVVPARAELVRKALAVFGEGAPEVWEEDGRDIGDERAATYDRILLDAPCTGLGALRRRPEARWRKVPRDVAELAELQAGLIDSALRALKPGGLLAYVTCSPHLAETKVVVEGALKKWAGTVERVDTQAALAGVVTEPLDLPEGSHVQLWPHRHGTDAMFIQLLTRTA